MSAMLGTLAIYAPIAMIVLILLYISISMFERAIREERPLLLSQMLLRQGAQVVHPMTRMAGASFAQAVRRCVNCVQHDSCNAWLDEGKKAGYENFCPNAPYIETLKKPA